MLIFQSSGTVFSLIIIYSSSLEFCGIQCSQKMEKNQERALRYFYKDFVSTHKELAKGIHTIYHWIKIHNNSGVKIIK